jgi:hypothetical protein
MVNAKMEAEERKISSDEEDFFPGDQDSPQKWRLCAANEIERKMQMCQNRRFLLRGAPPGAIPIVDHRIPNDWNDVLHGFAAEGLIRIHFEPFWPHESYEIEVLDPFESCLEDIRRKCDPNAVAHPEIPKLPQQRLLWVDDSILLHQEGNAMPTHIHSYYGGNFQQKLFSRKFFKCIIAENSVGKPIPYETLIAFAKKEKRDLSPTATGVKRLAAMDKWKNGDIILATFFVFEEESVTFLGFEQ